MILRLLLVLVCTVSFQASAQNNYSTTCFSYRSAMLVSDTMCVPASSPQLLVIVNELFCSQCLVVLDDFLSSNEILGRDYVILAVGSSVKKSHVNNKLAHLRRLIRDTRRLRFVESTVPGMMGAPSDDCGSPYIIIKNTSAEILISYDELFSHDSGKQLIVSPNAMLRAYENLVEQKN